ncbi:MAG: NAD(P)/FAD-dependent oxidoreductase [Flavobacteriales bacterium]
MKIDIPETESPRVVIIGGGFGGLRLARALKNVDVQVVLFDKNNYHTFQPLLYQVATSALEAESIIYPIRKALKGQKNFYFRMAEVKEVLPDDQIIITSISRLKYDYLIIATGAETNFFGNEGLMINAMPMKNIMESLNLRTLILQSFEKALVVSNKRKKQSLMNFVIAGGGPTGVELAGSLGEMKKNILPYDYPELDFSQMNIYLIQSQPRLLPPFSEKGSEKAKQYLEDLGVNVLLNTRVQDYQGDYVQTNTDDDLVARTLIWTAGVCGSPIEGINGEKIDKKNRVKVDRYNRVEGYERLFAVGDVAAMSTEEYPHGHPMVAPAAIQQGEHLARNIKCIMENKEMKRFEYFDKGSLATVGKNKAIAEIPKIKTYGTIAWFLWLIVHIMYLVGFSNKVMVIFNWMHHYFYSEKGLRVILIPFTLSRAKKKRKQNIKEKV